MINNVLVASDLSEQSDKALKRASLLAEQFSANLHILHVIKHSFYSRYMAMHRNNYDSEADKMLKDGAARTLKEKASELISDNINVECHITKGNIDHEILQFAKNYRIDCMILGAHGYHFFHDWYLGSTAENVIRHSTCPILVVKHYAQYPYQKVINAVDFSSVSQYMFDFSLRFLPKAEHTVLHVTNAWYEDALFEYDIKEMTPESLLQAMTAEIKQKMARFIEQSTPYEHQLTTKIKAGHPTKVLSALVEHNQYDLVVLGTQSHSSAHYLIIGSVANRILHEVDSDILMIPHPGH